MFAVEIIFNRKSYSKNFQITREFIKSRNYHKCVNDKYHISLKKKL